MLRRTSDGWRWPDDAAVSGSTPKRVASRAAELEAVSFHDATPPANAGLEPPAAVVRLAFADGTSVTVALGDRWEVPAPAVAPPPRRPGEPAEPPPGPRTVARQHARVDDGPVVEVDGALGDAIDDLFRELGRKRERDAEKRLDEAGGAR